ncbi:MAG: 50S ribosomal protein L17 [Ruminococcaceae bacterium]|nr:50S ribosomal protein L17 [Oscillospiraceae bacterium]
MPGTRKLGRKTAHRMSMLKGMVTLLLEKGKIETTLTRAKEIAPLAEKMITLGKKNTLASRRAAMAFITKEEVVAKLFNEIAPKYSERNGGYTQIYKLGFRRGDAAEMALLRLFEEPVKEEEKTSKKATKKAEEAPAAEAEKAADAE